MKKSVCLLLLIISIPVVLIAQPSPKEHFGFNIGDDYHLATFTQTLEYFNKLTTSDRVKLTSIGITEEGRNHPMLIITSPENHKRLEQIRQTSIRLARAEGISDEMAKQLAKEGKAVVWIDGGLHATETVGIHQLIETAWQLSSRTDEETLRILDQVVILMTHANPDGQELVSNWYMREQDPTKRKLDHLPRLYQKYIGHDNNRDFYMLNMKETQNMARQLFVDWIPQIMYNHHQAGPAGSVVAGPPYRDPFNYVFDPMCITGLDAIGAAMINRLNLEGKPGFTRLDGSVFSTWYNGGLRTTTYFHNMLGLLTEIIGSPTPSEVPLVPARLIPNNDTPFPVTPQKWHFRQSIDYSVSLNYAVLDYAARYRDQLLYNIYKMGRNSIDRGSNDTWTPYPAKLEAISKAFRKKTSKGLEFDEYGELDSKVKIPSTWYDSIFKTNTNRDPRTYILSSAQPAFPEAIKFANALIRTGIRVEKATAPFKADNKTYPANSLIIKTNQSFRPHILDMFEPQDHPNDFQYPGGPPVRPYDAAGWTLAFQMGIQFDRMMNDVSGNFETIPYGALIKMPGTLPSGGAGFILTSRSNASFTIVNDLLQAGVPVYRTVGSAKSNFAAGSFYIPASAAAKKIISKDISESGLEVSSVSAKPNDLQKVSKVRIALWDMYGGSMPSGWVRWLMEQYHFNADVIYTKDIDAGNLNSKYDALILVTGAVPPVKKEPVSSWETKDPKPEEVPTEFHSKIGRISVEKSIPELRKFMEAGGRIITIGTSANLAYHLGLPVTNALMEIDANGNERKIPNEKYYVPGSILRINLDSARASTWGAQAQTDVYFENSPVFKLSPEAVAKGNITPLAWFGNEAPLRSGWAWGQQYLKGGVAAFEAQVGNGSLVTFGPEITFRGQSHGTFKLLFNQLIQTESSVRIKQKR
jgi:hypothetical protein